jgi:hypothetical protein
LRHEAHFVNPLESRLRLRNNRHVVEVNVIEAKRQALIRFARLRLTKNLSLKRGENVRSGLTITARLSRGGVTERLGRRSAATLGVAAEKMRASLLAGRVRADFK